MEGRPQSTYVLAHLLCCKTSLVVPFQSPESVLRRLDSSSLWAGVFSWAGAVFALSPNITFVLSTPHEQRPKNETHKH